MFLTPSETGHTVLTKRSDYERIKINITRLSGYTRGGIARFLLEGKISLIN
jgi:hypothetical protein